jgi:hypothetical protein
MNAPQPSHRLTAWVALHAIAAHVWLTTQIGARARHLCATRRDDRGNAVVTAVLTVGLVLIAAVVLAVLRDKGEQIANNVCTNADPSTC